MKREELVKTLEIVGRALANNHVVPIFSHFCFTGSAVYSWNDSYGIVAPWTVKAPFACHGPTLVGLLKNSQANVLAIELTKEGLNLDIGNSLFTLPYVPPDQFLWQEPNYENNSVFVFDFDLIKGLEAALLTCTSDVALAAFNQIKIKLDESDNIVLYSCDGDAVTKYLVDVKLGEFGFKDFALSKAFCEAIIKTWYDSFDKDQTADGQLWVSEDWVCVNLSSGFKLFARTVTGSGLDYEGEISKSVNGKLEFVPIPKELDAALSRARIVADAETKPTILSFNEAEDDELMLQTVTHLGEIVDVIKMKHRTIAVKVSAALIQRSVKCCTEFMVSENCCIFRNGSKLLQLVSNMG